MKLKSKYVNERTGITYTLKGDYHFPNLSMPKATNFTIGRYGKAHLRHIKQYNKPLYTDLLLNGKLNNYLHSIDEKCNSLLESIVAKLAKQEDVTEDLKANHQLEWVARMNNIKNRAEEIVYNEYVYKLCIRVSENEKKKLQQKAKKCKLSLSNEELKVIL